jgi:tetrahydromethanopterin S-methyltransferase subunit G
MSDEQVVELLQSCTMKPEDIMQLDDIKSRMEILNEIEKRLRLIVEELTLASHTRTGRNR